MKNNGEAVSPVVGVMLMLVVTIIIAAVVSGFAGGMAGGTEVAPNVAMEVKIDLAVSTGTPGYTAESMLFEHLSGDIIQTEDLQIITYHTLDNGTTVKKVNDKNSDSSEFTTYYGSTTVLPYLADYTDTGGLGNACAHFGNYTIAAGDIMVVPGTLDSDGTSALEQFLGFDPEAGDVVDVKILHVPSEKYIYDKEVVVI